MPGHRYKLKYEYIENQDEGAGTGTIEMEPVVKKKIFTLNCCWSAFFTVTLITIYYIPSIGLTFYQRWLYQSFHFPLVTILIHMMVKYLLACILRLFLSCRSGKSRILLGWRDYIISVAPTGLASGIDISFSQWGLELVTISLYTMTKTTTIIFILAFSIFLKLEKKSWSICSIVIMISFGLSLFTYKATEFNMLGFVLLIIASIFSGIRWSCIQLLLQKSKMGMRHPIDMIYHMQPWMMLSVLPLALWIEGPSIIQNCQLYKYTDFSVPFNMACKVLLGAFIAFFMELSEVVLVTYTSSLTLAIAGICKEVFMLVLAVEWNGDRLSPINVTGLVICLCGITSHVVHKVRNMPSRFIERTYEKENERHELGDYLIDENVQYELSSESDGDKSDTQVIFDILNRHDR